MEEAGAAATRAAKRARLAPTGAPVAEASERAAASVWAERASEAEAARRASEVAAAR